MMDDLLRRHRAVLPAWMSLYYDEPVELVRGEGRRVWDAGGAEYLDFFGGILCTSVGHNVPEIVDAIREQAGRILHTSTAYLIRTQVELAELIAELSGIDGAKVFFTSSGTEAIEAALLLTTTFRRSNEILAMRNSYHGRTFGALGVTGNRGWSASSFAPLKTSYVLGADRFRSPFRHLPDDAYIAACVEELRDVLATTTSGDVACMIAEPIQGVGGFTYPPDGTYGAMQAVLDEHGIPFVSDEVQTAWGRTGDGFWGFEAHGVRPDMLVFAKGLANGVPIGGIAGRPEIVDSLRAASISTFGGNPLSTSAALATLGYILAHDLRTNAARVGAAMLERLRAFAASHPCVGDVRGKGLMLAVELVRPGTTDPWPEAATDVQASCRSNGLLVGKGGLYGNCLRIAPPMTVTLEEASDACDRIGAALGTLEAAVA